MLVAAGEDIVMRFASFSQQETHGICVLSATGSISKATLRRPGYSGVTLTYEGHFDIISLSGSFLTLNDGVAGTKTGGVSVSLVGPEGHVVGGLLAGLLIAATPVQVLLGSFNCDQDHQEDDDDEGEFDENEGEDMDAVASKLESKIDEDKNKDAGTSKLEPKLEPKVEPKLDVDEEEEEEGEDSVTSKFEPKLEFFG